MKTFKEWMEEVEEKIEWSQEELLNNIKTINSTLKVPSTPFQDNAIDPDSFYMSENGVFTFLYLDSIDLPETDKLMIAPPDTSHATMLYAKKFKISARHIPSGRYGIKKGYPIIVFWDPISSKIKKVLQIIWDRGLLHPQTYLYDTFGENESVLVSEYLKPKMPDKKRKELEVNVRIGMKEYPIYDLPRLLHTLPSAGEEWKNVANFICSNHTQYPILKNFLSKARCVTPASNKPYTPEFIRKKEYWPTSENNII